MGVALVDLLEADWVVQPGLPAVTGDGFEMVLGDSLATDFVADDF